MSDMSSVSTDVDDGDAGDAGGQIYTAILSAGGRKVAGSNPVARLHETPLRPGFLASIGLALCGEGNRTRGR
jgi:hypothetical protein